MRKNTIRKIVKTISPDIRVVFHSGNNESDILSRKVWLNFNSSWIDNETELHLQELYRHYPIAKTVSPEAFITLHEIGHIESVRNFQPHRVRAMLSQYSRGIENILRNDMEYRLQSRRYVKLKLERKANAWACEFIRNNPTIVAKLERALR